MSSTIDLLAKTAGYLKKIECERCSYSGKPLNDGRCPDCGAIGGVSPVGILPKEKDEYSKNVATKDLLDHIENSVNDINTYI
ncbi:MAG: hypothetical protein ACRCX2_22550 [Paraclostridium sp.]